MGTVLTPLDLVIFFGSLLAVMAVGLWAGRKEDTSEDFYLAGRSTRWWGVAGSIFGSNVSANHIVGMMGVGFAVGFAQSHFEITAIAGLLALCYVFLPVYRKLGLFTLSEYLSRRYNDASRVAYALIMIVIMVVIQMVPGFYIGSRSVNILLQGGPGEIDPTWYTIGIIVMAIVTGTYTIVGGLKAVIVTDVIQSVLLLAAGLAVAFITFTQPEVGGWANMVAMDAAGKERLHLYNPTDDASLPWTGVLSGLMVLHFYYWGTNQFIVQRALAARDDRQARLGIIAAGFFKLLIPFFSIGTGIAAWYLFAARGMQVDQDAVFTTLLTELIAPIGYGLVGLVAAGMIGAILSSLDSMMNSAATIVTFDFYKRYLNPEADEQTLIRVGRVCIVVFIIGAALLTIFTMDPNSKESFFLYVANHQGRLIAGVVVAFALGMLWKGATPAGAFVSIVAGVALSYGLPPLYKQYLGTRPSIARVFGAEINFLHTVFVAAVLCLLLHVAVSLVTRRNPEGDRFTWTGLEVFPRGGIARALLVIGFTLGLYLGLAGAMVGEIITPVEAAWGAAIWTTLAFWIAAVRSIARDPERRLGPLAILAEDRIWAGLLAGCAIFMMYFYF